MTSCIGRNGLVEVKKMKLLWIISGVFLIAVVAGLVIASPVLTENKNVMFGTQGSNEPYALNVALPESPQTAPWYKVVSKDSIFEGTPKSMELKASIPSESEATALAEKALQKYGGLPGDAVLKKVQRVNVKKYDTKTGVSEEGSPLFTQVIYTQQVNASPVIGPGAEINIELGENGEVLAIEKAWPHLEYAGEVNIITAQEAYEKLKKGDTITLTQSSPLGKQVTDVKLGYYAEHRDKDQKNFMPVWIFYAAGADESPFPYPVDAVKSN